MVKAMDDAIGQVMDALDRKGVLDETLVMFLNDNGGPSEAGGNLPYPELKRSYFEGGIRVPAVMRWPGRITAGSVSDSLMHVSEPVPYLRRPGRSGHRPRPALSMVSMSGKRSPTAPRAHARN